MASNLGIDLGEVYRTAEAVKTSRAARGASEKAAEQTATVNTLAAGAAAGDKDAMAGLIALDPKRATEITAAYTALDEAGRKEKQAQVDQIGALAAGILSAPDPAAVYATMLTQLDPELAATFPKTYDENWVKFQLGQATETSKIFDSIDEQQNYTRDRADELADDATDQQQAIELEGIQHTNKVAETVAEAEATGEGGTIKSADTNAIRAQVATLFGGTVDPVTGNMSITDPEAAPRVAELQEKAEKLFAAGGITHAEAVATAAEELGIRIRGVTARTNNVIANGGNPAADGPPTDPFNLGF